MDLAAVAGLRESIGRHVQVRAGSQGWTDAQQILSLVLLNVAGGDSVDDLRKLDEGFLLINLPGRVLERARRLIVRLAESSMATLLLKVRCRILGLVRVSAG